MNKDTIDVIKGHISDFNGIYIELTNICNFNCVFCPNIDMTRKRGFMETELAKKMIDEIDSKGESMDVRFHVMGEPMLHPNFFDILEYTKDKENLTITLITNGSRFTKENCSKLFNLNPKKIFISFTTPNKESYILRNSKLEWEKYLERIKNAIRAKFENNSSTEINIEMGFIPTISLKDKLINFFEGRPIDTIKTKEEAKEVVDEWRSYARQIKSDFRSENPNIKMIENQRYEILPNVFLRNRPIYNWSHNTYTIKHASCHRTNFAILWNGDLTVCCMDYNGEGVMGNIKKESIEDILRSSRMQEFRRGLENYYLTEDLCRKCKGRKSFVTNTFAQIYHIINKWRGR